MSKKSCLQARSQDLFIRGARFFNFFRISEQNFFRISEQNFPKKEQNFWKVSKKMLHYIARDAREKFSYPI